MAFLLDSTTSSNTTTNNPLTLLYTCGSNANLLVLLITGATTTARTGGTPTYCSKTFTNVGATVVGSGECTSEMWYMTKPCYNSSTNISVPNAGTLSMRIRGISFKTTNTNAEIEHTTSSNVTVVSPALSSPNISAGSVIVANLASGDAVVSTGVNRTIIELKDNGAWADAAQYYITPSSGNYVMKIAQGSDDVAHIVSTWKFVNYPTTTCVFLFKDLATSTGYGFASTWTGKTDYSPSISTVNLEIYKVNNTGTKLLAHFDGAASATAYTAETGQTVTFAGTSQLNTFQKKFGTTSLWGDGNSDYVTIPDSGDWDFGTGDFTVDFWVMFSSYSVANIYELVNHNDGSDPYWHLYLETGYLVIQFVNGATTITRNVAFTPTVDTWYHLVFERNTTTAKIFVNGTSQTLGGATDFGVSDVGIASGVLCIGRNNVGGANYFHGYIDELRITKGYALWIESFAVPTKDYPYAPTWVNIASNATTSADAYFSLSHSQSRGNLSIADFYRSDTWVSYRLTQMGGNISTDYWKDIFSTTEAAVGGVARRWGYMTCNTNYWGT